MWPVPRDSVDVWEVKGAWLQLRQDGSLIGQPVGVRRTVDALGFPRRRGGVVRQPLRLEIAGMVARAHAVLSVQLVLPSNHKVVIAPEEPLRLLRRWRDVTKTERHVRGVRLRRLRWSKDDLARVESYDGFELVAWTSRLSAKAAFAYLRGLASPGANLWIDTFDGTHEMTDSDRPPDEMMHSPHRVLRIRLENDAETFVWEYPADPKARPPARATAGGRPEAERRPPQFALMATTVGAARVTQLVGETGTARVALGLDDIVAELPEASR